MNLPPYSEPTTSKDAAKALKPSRREITLEKVYAFIAAAGPYGATDEEIQIGLAMAGNTQRPRRGELLEGGRIAQSGTRLTQSGRQAKVWVATTPQQ